MLLILAVAPLPGPTPAVPPAELDASPFICLSSSSLMVVMWSGEAISKEFKVQQFKYGYQSTESHVHKQRGNESSKNRDRGKQLCVV